MTQREIKFRAWHKSKMVEDVGVLEGFVVDRSFHTYNTPNIEVEKLVDAIPMQYTGLKDANGVEIYEGDIIRQAKYRHDRGSEQLSIVTWKPLNASFGLKHNSEQEFWLSFNQVKQNVEVIGNIYENGDLLK